MAIARVRPLYTPDMPISDLRTAETVILVTLRLRALQWREPDNRHPDWHDGLEAGNLPSWAVDAFEDLFQIVATMARYPLDVRGLRCLQLGFDEGQFLQTVSFFQHCQREQAEATLKDWLSAGAYRLAAYPAASLACAFEQADLIIGPRDLVAAVTECQLKVIPRPTRFH